MCVFAVKMYAWKKRTDKNKGRYLTVLNFVLLLNTCFFCYEHLVPDVYKRQIIYMGSTHESQGNICGQLLEYGSGGGDIEGGMYLDGDSQHLIKQMDFLYPDKGEGSLFIVSNVDELIPEVQSMVREMILSGVMILIFTGCALTMWVYRSILRPLGKLQEATKNIRDGNLEFTLEVEEEDEIGQLCQDFEEMRQRLKESTEEKIQYDKENKELILSLIHI